MDDSPIPPGGMTHQQWNDWIQARTDVLNDVMRERIRQMEKWGRQTHSIEKWVVILMEEVGEVAQEALEIRNDAMAKHDLYKELIQVAAVAAAIAQAIKNQKPA